jgi:hypothetical protein
MAQIDGLRHAERKNSGQRTRKAAPPSIMQYPGEPSERES